MKLILSKTQLDKFADLCLGIGQLSFGSTVVPYIIPSLDRPPLSILVLGVGFAFGLWFLAIKIVKD